MRTRSIVDNIRQYFSFIVKEPVVAAMLTGLYLFIGWVVYLIVQTYVRAASNNDPFYFGIIDSISIVVGVICVLILVKTRYRGDARGEI